MSALRMPRPTVRLRLTLIYGALFLLSGVVLTTVTYVLVSRATSGTIFASNPGTGGQLIAVNRSGGESVLVQTPDGVVPPGSPPPPFLSGPISVAPGSDTARTLADRLTALAQQQRDDQLHQLLASSAIALGGMALLSLGLGWLIAGRVLRPLQTITDTARSISASNLHHRLQLAGPNDELKELGDTFDGLLGRLEQSFDAQRQFIANASHELRTPLARQRTLIEVALRDPVASVETLRTAHQRVLAAGQEQEHIIEALLVLARSERGIGQREPCDLRAITEEVTLGRAEEIDRHGLHLEAALDAAQITGDAQLVERLVSNLVENAVRHNVENGTIDVTTRMSEGRAVLSVSSTGETIPADQVERLFQPFQRFAGDRAVHTDGVGLGLSIVRAIATAHGATIAAAPRGGGGLTVEVAFPTAVG